MTDEKFLEQVRQLTLENKMILLLAIYDIKDGLDPKPPEEYRKIIQERVAKAGSINQLLMQIEAV